MATLPSRAITIRIEAPYDAAYGALSDPAAWPQWAAGLGAGLTRTGAGVWTVNTVAGEPAQVRFSEINAFGVLDHTVILPSGDEVRAPMRLIRNGDGCEVIFTLLRLPTMDDETFAADGAMVERDLAALKALLER